MITIRCSCGKQLKVKDERAGIKVKCPECEEVLRVPEAGGIKEKTGPGAPPPRTKPRPMEDDEGIEDRPRRRSRADEDKDEDRPRRRSARADDEDDRAHRRRQKAGGNGLMIGIIVGSVLLLAGGGLALFFFLKSDSAGPGRGPGNGGGDLGGGVIMERHGIRPS